MIRRVAYQGEPGAFSEAAARSYWGHAAEPLAQHTFEDVARAVAEGDAAFGLVPVENTLAGAVAPAWDAIAAAELTVIGEVVWPIEMYLLGVPGATLDGVRRALSHPVALAQCGRFFRAHAKIGAVAVHDTAGAARQVAELRDPSAAAIAGRHTAGIYGLEVIAENIQDRPDNQTRFFVVAPDDASLPTSLRTATYGRGRRDEGEGGGHGGIEAGGGRGQWGDEMLTARMSAGRKTALLIETPNQPGALLAVLGPIARAGINLTHLACRPGDEPWTYRFFIEIGAGVDDDAARAALDAIRPRTTSFRIMGSFPAAPEPRARAS